MGWVANATPGRFTLGKDPVPTVEEADCAPGPIWTGAENLSPTGTRSPDRPARSESLYGLSSLLPCNMNQFFNPLYVSKF